MYNLKSNSLQFTVLGTVNLSKSSLYSWLLLVYCVTVPIVTIVTIVMYHKTSILLDCLNLILSIIIVGVMHKSYIKSLSYNLKLLLISALCNPIMTIWILYCIYISIIGIIYIVCTCNAFYDYIVYIGNSDNSWVKSLLNHGTLWANNGGPGGPGGQGPDPSAFFGGILPTTGVDAEGNKTVFFYDRNEIESLHDILKQHYPNFRYTVCTHVINGSEIKIEEMTFRKDAAYYQCKKDLFILFENLHSGDSNRLMNNNNPIIIRGKEDLALFFNNAGLKEPGVNLEGLINNNFNSHKYDVGRLNVSVLPNVRLRLPEVFTETDVHSAPRGYFSPENKYIYNKELLDKYLEHVAKYNNK